MQKQREFVDVDSTYPESTPHTRHYWTLAKFGRDLWILPWSRTNTSPLSCTLVHWASCPDLDMNTDLGLDLDSTLSQYRPFFSCNPLHIQSPRLNFYRIYCTPCVIRSICIPVQMHSFLSVFLFVSSAFVSRCKYKAAGLLNQSRESAQSSWICQIGGPNARIACRIDQSGSLNVCRRVSGRSCPK